MVQFQGGYRYPSGWVSVVLSLIATGATVLIWNYKSLYPLQTLTLFLNLEGIVLLASAFSPIGLTPPQGSAVKRTQWFFSPQGGVPVGYSQPMFYFGLLFVSIAIILNAIQD